MRKQWLGICIAAGLLAACSSDDVQQKTVSTPQPAVCNGPTVEISGADPQYETPNATANQDYERDGKSYKIVQDPANFTQAGFAAITGGLSATVSRQEDLGAVQTPIIFMQLIPMYTAMYLVPYLPEATITKVLSYIPAFSPYLMPMRAAIGEVPLWGRGAGAEHG